MINLEIFMKNYIPQTQYFNDFLELLNAAETKYTLSLKDACKALKCSRSYAQKYIRPNVPSIYLSNGKGTGKVNYAKLVSSIINKRKNNIDNNNYSNESIYLDEKAFNSFILSCITSCKKRSKKAYKTFFIKTDCLEVYYKELLNLYLSLTKNIKTDKNILNEIDILYLKYAKNNYVKNIIHPAIVQKDKRTTAEFINVAVPNIPIREWQAVHDLMDYGDIEETIYRQLFKEGCIRLEIKLPDKNGEIKDKGKIYYIPDPVPIKQPILNTKDILKNYDKKEHNSINEIIQYLIYTDCINIKQSAWIEYNKMLGNNITY